jgi:plastocyanin
MDDSTMKDSGLQSPVFSLRRQPAVSHRRPKTGDRRLVTFVIFVTFVVVLFVPIVVLAAGGGTIKGHVKLTGKPPGNVIIRMGMDPMCSKANAGKRVIQEAVLVTADGSLANVFVKVQGSFPGAAVPGQPVTIDQRGCVYLPRVVGARVGQTVQVHNGDALLHNVHGLSAGANGFNVSQPSAGMTYQFRPKQEEMLRLKCDVHGWMTAFVGIVSHPYFAVSGGEGTFEIHDVPAGTRTVEAWHERYGPLKKTVKVTAGGTTSVEFAYTGNEPPPR